MLGLYDKFIHDLKIFPPISIGLSLFGMINCLKNCRFVAFRGFEVFTNGKNIR